MVPGKQGLTGNIRGEAVPDNTVQDEIDVVPKEMFKIDLAVHQVIEALLTAPEGDEDINIPALRFLPVDERAKDPDHGDPEPPFQIGFMLAEEGKHVCHGLYVWDYSIPAINA